MYKYHIFLYIGKKLAFCILAGHKSDFESKLFRRKEAS